MRSNGTERQEEPVGPEEMPATDAAADPEDMYE